MSDEKIGPVPHAWFTIDGIQAGKYTVKDRLFALDRIKPHARGASVLDIGCAEGLLSKWLIDICGAKSVTGLEKHAPYAEMARHIMRGYDAAYHVVDLDFFETWLEYKPGELAPNYDIVLALRVIQKLARPASFVKAIAPFVGKYLVVQIPTNAKGIMVDARSGCKPFDIEAELRGTLAVDYRDVRPMHRDHELTIVFKRSA